MDDDGEQLAPGDEPKASDDEQEPVTIVKATVIKGGHLKKQPWLPDLQLVGGVEYIKLHKWCRDLTLFVTGTALNFAATSKRPVHNINVQWFEDMKKKRQEACDAAVRKVITEAAEAEGKPLPKRIRQAREEDQFLIGKTVTIFCPEIRNNEDEVLQAPKEIQFLWGTKSDLFMELNADNLDYIRAAIKESTPFVQQISSKRAKATQGSVPPTPGMTMMSNDDEPGVSLVGLDCMRNLGVAVAVSCTRHREFDEEDVVKEESMQEPPFGVEDVYWTFDDFSEYQDDDYNMVQKEEEFVSVAVPAAEYSVEPAGVDRPGGGMDDRQQSGGGHVDGRQWGGGYGHDRWGGYGGGNHGYPKYQGGWKGFAKGRSGFQQGYKGYKGYGGYSYNNRWPSWSWNKKSKKEQQQSSSSSGARTSATTAIGQKDGGPKGEYDVNGGHKGEYVKGGHKGEYVDGGQKGEYVDGGHKGEYVDGGWVSPKGEFLTSGQGRDRPRNRAGAKVQQKRETQNIRQSNKALIETTEVYQQHMGQALDTMSRLARMLEQDRS
ncbi:unnamed protein product [Symbiodinium sp. CCMP2592]|nr:unnamed protein product [Symbiodinium sp. CCMP2592]